MHSSIFKGGGGKIDAGHIMAEVQTDAVAADDNIMAKIIKRKDWLGFQGGIIRDPGFRFRLSKGGPLTGNMFTLMRSML